MADTYLKRVGAGARGVTGAKEDLDQPPISTGPSTFDNIMALISPAPSAPQPAVPPSTDPIDAGSQVIQNSVSPQNAAIFKNAFRK